MISIPKIQKTLKKSIYFFIRCRLVKETSFYRHCEKDYAESKDVRFAEITAKGQCIFEY